MDIFRAGEEISSNRYVFHQKKAENTRKEHINNYEENKQNKKKKKLKFLGLKEERKLVEFDTHRA